VSSSNAGCNTAVPSAAVTLTVNPLVGIGTQPLSQTVCESGPVSFTVAASGTGPYSYQWRENGVALSDGTVLGVTYAGSTGAMLTLSGASLSGVNGKQYSVVVSGGCGVPVTSVNAVLTINELPEITVQPSSQVSCLGSSATFSVNAGVTSNPTYQWRKGGVKRLPVSRP